MRPPDYRCSNSSRIEKPCSCNPTIEIRKLDAIVWEKVGEELNEHGYIIGALELLKGSIKQENDIEAIERSIAKCKEELEQLSKDLMGVRGYTRDLLLKQMQGIEESIEKLEAEKREALPGSEQTKEKEVAIDNFMGWLKRMKGRYNEATYEEKREALRMLGVTVHVYRRDDPEHERYEIYFSLRDIVSQQAPRSESALSTGGKRALS